MLRTKKWSIGLALSASACGALLAVASGSAQADTITLGLQQAGVNGSAITAQTPTGSGSLTIGPISYGTFSINSLLASDTVGSALPELLNSTSLNVSSGNAGTIEIWVTAQGLTQPTGTAPILSSLTSNSLPAGWSVTENTYYSATNGLFDSGATLLSSHPFTAIGTKELTSLPVTFASPFSITEEYILTSNGSVSTALSTIKTSVPEPGTLALFGAGLLGCALFVGRRRRSLRDRV